MGSGHFDDFAGWTDINPDDPGQCLAIGREGFHLKNQGGAVGLWLNSGPTAASLRELTGHLLANPDKLGRVHVSSPMSDCVPAGA